MEVAWNPWAIPSMVVVAGALVMSVLVWTTNPGRAQNRLLAAYLFLEGFAFLWLSVGGMVSASPSTAHAASAIGYPVWLWVIVLYLFFISTLDTPLVKPLRSVWARSAIILLATTMTIIAFLFPQTWSGGGSYEPWYGGYGSGPSALNRGLFISALAVSLFALVAAIFAMLRTPRGTPARLKARFFVAAFVCRDAGMVIFAVAALLEETAYGTNGVSALDFALLFVWPLSITFFHFLLAAGILRTQLFDIDLKIKWTIKKSTLFAIFVASFFVVSESAALFFGERMGPYLGIVAAGLLVFVITPLQRLAQRVADAAMPDVENTDEYRTVRKRAVYQAAVQEALANGDVSEENRNLLATLADQLGLSNREVVMIEKELLNNKKQSSRANKSVQPTRSAGG